MKYEHWQIPAAPEDAIKTLMDAGYPYLVSSVLAARGVTTSEQAAEALEREKTLAYSPFLMKDMDKAVARISRALENGEKLAVFGDYDVDGITSTCLLTDYLRSRGADVTMHIPRRSEEGYGRGRDAIRALSESGVTLIVTVDCGITGVDETAYAATLGVDLVITDHHECKEKLPAAVAVVDPHRPDCPYPFKHLAGVGVALKLVLALGEGREDALFARYCTLAAIGTIADVMRMEGENRTIVQCGLESIDRSDFTGLHALLREAGLTSRPISSIQIGFVLAPRINAAGRMGRAELAAELLLTDDPVRAEKLARELCELNRERQSVEQDIFRRAIEQMEDLPESERSALVLSSEDWHQGVVGIVASRLSEKFSCPSFMIHLSGGSGKGSCRSYGGFNLFNALEACSDLLVSFGGHELAAGFTIEERNIPAFRTRMNQYVRAHTGEHPPVSMLDVDVDLQHPSLITLEEVEALSLLEPYGAGNNRPDISLRGVLPKIQQIEGVEIVKGRFINQADIHNYRKVIVIDEALERILFRGDDPLGKPVKIHNNIYRVAGVYRGDAQQRNSMGYIPLTTGQLIFKANDPVVDNAIITVHGLDTDAQMEAFEQRIRKRLAAEHHYDPEDQSALWIRNTMEQYKSMMIVFGGINLFVWIIGLGTLLAGIVGVSNIMLVTVTERTSEFGIRKALGAKPVSIIRLILTESVMITAMFGYIGMVLGVAVMEAVNYVINQTPAQTGNFGGSIFLNPTLDLGVAVSATVVLVIAGLIAGYVPAYRAAQLKTIDALRYNK